MAKKKPVVLDSSGNFQQLQSGDFIGDESYISQTNGEATTIVVGTPVYKTTNANEVKKSKADASGTMKVIGLVADTAGIASAAAGNIQIEGTISLTTAQWDAVAGTSGGLTAGTTYYASATSAGILTATAPSTATQYVQKVLLALSTTDAILLCATAEAIKL